MKRIISMGVWGTSLCIAITGCGNFQEDTNIDDERNVSLGIGYIEDDKVYVNDRDGNEITFEKTEDIVVDFSEYEKVKYPLLAKIEEEDIYLYEDKGKGSILVKGEFVEYLDLGENGFITPRWILPQLSSGDYDNDSKNEIAIVSYVGSGTGISFQELCVLDDDEGYEEYYTAYYLNNLGYTELLEDTFSYEVDDSDNVTMTIEDTEYNLNKIENISRLVCGDNTYFNVTGKEIKIYTHLGAIITDMASPQYDGLGWLEASVGFSKDDFVLSDVRYNTDTEFNPFEIIGVDNLE